MADYQGQYTGQQIDAAIGKAHEHSNKALLDTYTQTETNLADAVGKKHDHSNKSVIDAITSVLTSAWSVASTWVATNGANVLSHIADTTIHVTSQLVAVWNAKYDKPSGGIPKTDLASGVQTSLGKADSALQSHQSLAAYRTSADQDVIDAGKQASISDLDTIRSGAGLGSTALQSVPNTYRTAAEQDAIHDSTKADKVTGTHTNEIVTLDSGGNVQASGKTVADFAEPSPRGAETVTAGATAITVALVADKMHTIDLTNAGSAVTLTFSASKTGLDLTKENVFRAKVLVPASGVAVTFAWDSVTSAGTLAWAGENAPAFTAGKTTEINIDLAIGNVNFEGMSVEF